MQLLECAVDYQLDGWKSILVKCNVDLINQSNCCNTLMRSEQLGLQDLKKKHLRLQPKGFLISVIENEIGLLDFKLMEL